ncbi:hypothetical protein GO003_014430 [Methylicorpusculum oleiharenae]|uniref:hypothetical protein n=1 Tax=Methylicorpusculum oleiharenae TaxID=1338687 RepID=UPI001357D979|nr:hypothetical protein [Methylicorpusculum oleiharenae]MCD2451588.1 hypothetical protein [Methylicorpusculum oleiharenae]
MVITGTVADTRIPDFAAAIISDKAFMAGLTDIGLMFGTAIFQLTPVHVIMTPILTTETDIT